MANIDLDEIQKEAQQESKEEHKKTIERAREESKKSIVPEKFDKKVWIPFGIVVAIMLGFSAYVMFIM